jgi:hypothetical protein
MRLLALAADDSEPDRRQAAKAAAIALPLRGFGLDCLAPTRFGPSKQTRADWERSRFQSGTESTGRKWRTRNDSIVRHSDS